MIAINPANGEEIKSYPLLNQPQVEQTIEASRFAFLSWRRTAFSERSRHMKIAARILRENTSQYAELMTLEMGKPIKEGRGEVEKCAWVCDYYADNAEGFLKPEIIPTNASESFVSFQPLGVILAVMPWNFPFWQVFRFAAPALMAGNAAILKHASNVPGCALAIQDIFNQ
ncbi:MAG: aldehyde dehydrogenase family protein, partial [Candidatus Aminicenantes bacterium]|nr:aldehyde dehydrogenase family protein [Candidatus Aminicenantes bacterium]